MEPSPVTQPFNGISSGEFMNVESGMASSLYSYMFTIYMRTYNL